MTKSAFEILSANLSPRYKRLDRLDRYVDGTIYDDRPDWFNPDRRVPLLNRRPCIVYPITEIAIQGHGDMVLGEGRYPEMYFPTDETAFDPMFALTDDESELLHEFWESAQEHACLKTVSREALKHAESCGTAVTLLTIRNGRLKAQNLLAKWCTPEFDQLTDELTKLTVSYPYLVDYQDDDGSWCKRCMIYKRVITPTSDTVYKPVEASEDGKPVKQNTVQESVEHNIGFVPVVWYAFLKSTAPVSDHDGNALHGHLLDELDALNFALSQRHRAALYSSDPQIIEVGVNKDEEPGQMGPKARPTIIPGENGSSYFSVTGGSNSDLARMRGPGQIWRYESSDVEVSMLTLPGDALVACETNADDIRSKLCEALHIVIIDQDSVKYSAEVSGAALREYYKRQVEFCDTVREDFEENYLKALCDLALRLVLNVDSVYLPAVKQVKSLLQRFQTTDGWFPPAKKLAWKQYFRPSYSDEAQVATLTTMLLDKQVITRRSAVEKIAQFFDIDNVDEYMTLLEAEAPPVEPESEPPSDDINPDATEVTPE